MKNCNDVTLVMKFMNSGFLKMTLALPCSVQKNMLGFVEVLNRVYLYAFAVNFSNVGFKVLGVSLLRLSF